MKLPTKLLTISLMTLLLATGMQVAHAEGQGPCSGWFSNVRPDMNDNGHAADTTDRALVNHRMERLIACAVRLWPVAGGYVEAVRIAHRESGDPWIWPWAYNASGCAGTYQQMLRYWAGRVAAYWNREWLWKVPTAFNPRANVIVSIRMAHASGWSAWS